MHCMHKIAFNGDLQSSGGRERERETRSDTNRVGDRYIQRFPTKSLTSQIIERNINRKSKKHIKSKYPLRYFQLKTKNCNKTRPISCIQISRKYLASFLITNGQDKTSQFTLPSYLCIHIPHIFHANVLLMWWRATQPPLLFHLAFEKQPKFAVPAIYFRRTLERVI